jgi:hypothetical protein
MRFMSKKSTKRKEPFSVASILAKTLKVPKTLATLATGRGFTPNFQENMKRHIRNSLELLTSQKRGKRADMA